MKLIDLLVQELPKRGGWPEGADWCVYHDIDEEVSFGYGLSPLLIDGTWTTTENDSHWLCRGDFYHQNSNDFNAAIVTSDQYEAALAASQKVEWSGDGLPPVGVKCEIIINEGNLGLCEIIFVGQSLLVWRQDSTYQEGSGYHRHMKFRPLRSEEDKKRDDVAKFESGVSALLKVPTTQGQFDAMVSLAYNIGLGNFGKSTLLRKHNEKCYSCAAGQFPAWNRAAGKVMNGLTRRRNAERDVYMS